MENNKWIIVIGALLAALGVGLGAIGAHALPGYLERQAVVSGINDPSKLAKKIDNYEKAVRYQLYHALALVVFGLSSNARISVGIRVASYFFIAGVLLFCGGIYGSIFTELPTHWVIPLGGVSFILGWLSVSMTAMRLRK